jgi:hypothetical protein
VPHCEVILALFASRAAAFVVFSFVRDEPLPSPSASQLDYTMLMESVCASCVSVLLILLATVIGVPPMPLLPPVLRFALARCLLFYWRTQFTSWRIFLLSADRECICAGALLSGRTSPVHSAGAFSSVDFTNVTCPLAMHSTYSLRKSVRSRSLVLHQMPELQSAQSSNNAFLALEESNLMGRDMVETVNRG